MEESVKRCQLRAVVIPYDVIKPDYAKSRVWNVVCGREAIRKYLLDKHEFAGFLSLDVDMTCDTSIIDIMIKELEGYDAVFSGYRLRVIGTGLTGGGCVMISRKVLENITFRCYEFKNGDRITEDNALEMDLFRVGARIKKGIFWLSTIIWIPTGLSISSRKN